MTRPQTKIPWQNSHTTEISGCGPDQTEQT